jgi:ubiquilin
MAAMMGMMGGGGGMMPAAGMPQQPAAPADTRPPEERYKDQLDQLMGMGFADQASNIQALQATQGNVQLAIERLLNN